MIDLLYHDAALARFYDLENGWGDDLAFCSRLAEEASSILDLGCGTGRFLSALAGERRVGVDPARAMLDIARQRPGGATVAWIEADARTVRLGQTFDLIVMTGHAFQTLLTDADQLAACQTIAAHLSSGGQFIFDTREPGREEWREWTPQQSQRWVDDPQLGRLRAFNDVHHDATTGIVTYGTYYELADGTLLQAQSQIRFAPKTHIERLLSDTGLKADQWLGSWKGEPYDSAKPEIIVMGRLA